MEYTDSLDLKEYSGMHIGGMTDSFVFLNTEKELPDIVAYLKELDVRIWVIGEGTNTIFSEDVSNTYFLINNIKDISTVGEDDKSMVLDVGAGESWDDFVGYSVEEGLSGLEALSLIPGSVGATPVQNVGAYGAEVGSVIESVHVYDIEKKEYKWMSGEACGFEYRSSVFKKNPGKYIITKVRFRLSKEMPTMPDYPDVVKYFEENHSEILKSSNTNTESVGDHSREWFLGAIREAVISIRERKLLDYKEVPNCGSFFTNPVIEQSELERLQKEFPEMKAYEGANGLYKVPAGWLLEKAGFKGAKLGPIEISEKHALILSNPSRTATFRDLQNAEKHIQKNIKEKFGVDIAREPVVCK